MNKIIYLLLFVFLFFSPRAQQLRLKGNTKDTVNKTSLPNALLMAIKFTDSTLVNFTRSNEDGEFRSITVPLDTYIVIISHPKFSDKTYFLVPSENDTVFSFKNVIPARLVIFL